AHKLARIAQKGLLRHILREFRAQESFVRSILEEPPNQVRHAGQEFADGTIFTHAISHLNESAFDWSRHSVKQLKFETAAINAELISESLRIGNAANVM